jgi:hypothetical protein
MPTGLFFSRITMQLIFLLRMIPIALETVAAAETPITPGVNISLNRCSRIIYLPEDNLLGLMRYVLIESNFQKFQYREKGFTCQGKEPRFLFMIINR